MSRKHVLLAGFLVVLLAASTALFVGIQSNEARAQQLAASEGKITFFRVNEGGYSAGANFMDADLIVRVGSEERSLGLQLRNDAKLPRHQAMFESLLDAYKNNYTVRLEYFLEWGNNGRIIRVILIK